MTDWPAPSTSLLWPDPDPLQHLHNPVFPHEGCNATPGPRAAYLPPGLLQLSDWTVTAYPEYCSVPHFDLSKFSHVTPLLLDLQWLPVVARIRLKINVLAFKAINGTAPVYFQTLVRLHTQAQALCSTASACQLVLPLLRAKKAHSAKLQLFYVLLPQWWNKLPANVRTVVSLTIFHKRLKTQDSFVQTSPPPSKACHPEVVRGNSNTCIASTSHSTRLIPFALKHLQNKYLQEVMIDEMQRFISRDLQVSTDTAFNSPSSLRLAVSPSDKGKQTHVFTES